jgi:microcin C transport system substrate-binding protein
MTAKERTGRCLGAVSPRLTGTIPSDPTLLANCQGEFRVRFTRRNLIQALTLFAVPISPLARRAARAEDKVWRHGLSLFGNVKYPAGFNHFEYVNADAPKGGTVRQISIGTFDNFNQVISEVKGNLVLGLGHIYDQLTVGSLDEVSTSYGLLADAASYPPDFSSVTYRLRPEAKWHDGTPVTPEDVIFSLDVFKKNSPGYAAYYRHVTGAEKSADREITFRFDAPGNRELPQIVGELTILPKHWWEGVDDSGNKRDVTATTLEKPLGSGAYRIKEFVPGRSITYERVKNYWGKDINVSVGRDNFDEITYEYFRDSTVAIEAFKADQIDWRFENSAKDWATAYKFPAVDEKRVVLEEFPVRSIGVMQAFAFNIRRDKFKDPLLRRAFNFAFDFEEMNKQLFFGQYHRIASYFEGTELASSGLPAGMELDILETLRNKVPPEVFTTPYTNPQNGNGDETRANLREALKLLRQAGYEVRDTKLVNSKTGEPLSVELLVDNPQFERVMLFYKPSLERMGITVSIRTVDPTQYEYRLRNWDYDIITAGWTESLSPGNEQRDRWGSQAADLNGSSNWVGIKNPAVDALIDRIIFAKSREELVAATHALDRVLLWNHYVVPQWTYGKERTARWDRFGHPEKLPEFGASAFPTIWWWDEEKAEKLGKRQ